MRTRSLFAVVIVSVVALASAACGARGPLDDFPEDFPPTTDASGSLDGQGPNDGANDLDGSASDTSTTSPVDASVDSNNPVDCALCVGQSCSSDILSCVTNQSCLSALQCVFGTCLAGGSLSAQCALGCAGDGGAQGILAVLSIFQCVVSSCGADCTSLLGGLGGLGGLDPIPASQTPSGSFNPNDPRNRDARRNARQAFSAWQEITSRIAE